MRMVLLALALLMVLAPVGAAAGKRRFLKHRWDHHEVIMVENRAGLE